MGKLAVILAIIYLCNLGFCLLCLLIGANGFFVSMGYEVVSLVQIVLLFVPVSFCEFCMVQKWYYKKKKVYGEICVPMDFRDERQYVVLVLFYVSAFIISFFLSLEKICLYICFFLMYMILVNATKTGRVFWMGGQKSYIMNETGEVYPVKKSEKQGNKWIVFYENSKGKECMVKGIRKSCVK